MGYCCAPGGRLGMTSVGGKRLSYACWLNRVRLVPHSRGTPIRIAAEMHWVACFPDVSRAWNRPPVLFELHLPHESPAWGLTTKRIELDKADGMIAVPTGPGLGIEINRDELERYRWLRPGWCARCASSTATCAASSRSCSRLSSS